MIVLGFLNNQPLYGYKIGQIISEGKISVWTGIRLPSIYKALQTLERKKCIKGTEMSEGYSPPRTVFTITSKGKEYLRDILKKNLVDECDNIHDFWLSISFANNIFGKNEILELIDQYLANLEQANDLRELKHCEKMKAECSVPFAHKHLMDLSVRLQSIQQKTIRELKEAIIADKYSEYLIPEEN